MFIFEIKHHNAVEIFNEFYNNFTQVITYIQYADAHDQKQPHVHVKNKIIKTISYNENITIKTKNVDN
mgnify:CR=1 FL=1